MFLSTNDTNISELGNFKVGNFVSEVCDEEFIELLIFGVEKLEFLVWKSDISVLISATNLK